MDKFYAYRELGAAVILQVCTDYFNCLRELKRYSGGGDKIAEIYQLCDDALLNTSQLLYESDEDKLAEIYDLCNDHSLRLPRCSKKILEKIKNRIREYKELVHEKNDLEDFFLSDYFNLFSFDSVYFDGEDIMHKIREREESGSRNLYGGFY